MIIFQITTPIYKLIKHINLLIISDYSRFFGSFLTPGSGRATFGWTNVQSLLSSLVLYFWVKLKLWPSRLPGIPPGRLGKALYSSHYALLSYDKHNPAAYEIQFVCDLPLHSPLYKITLCQICLVGGKTSIYS